MTERADLIEAIYFPRPRRLACFTGELHAIAAIGIHRKEQKLRKVKMISLLAAAATSAGLIAAVAPSASASTTDVPGNIIICDEDPTYSAMVVFPNGAAYTSPPNTCSGYSGVGGGDGQLIQVGYDENNFTLIGYATYNDSQGLSVTVGPGDTFTAN